MSAHYCPECGHEHLPAGDAATPAPLDTVFAGKHNGCGYERPHVHPENAPDEAAYLAATPAPLDVERLARAMERMSGVADPIDPGDCMAGVVTHREFAAAIAAAYAEEK